jgi:hypothetical protein
MRLQTYLEEAKKIESRNKAWGYYNEISNRLRGTKAINHAEAFDKAVKALMKAFKLDANTARDFLDASEGRHTADSFTDAILANPTPMNFLKHPWMKKAIASFLKTYDAKQFAMGLRSSTETILKGRLMLEADEKDILKKNRFKDAFKLTKKAAAPLLKKKLIEPVPLQMGVYRITDKGTNLIESFVVEKKTKNAIDFIIGQLQNDEVSTDAEMILHLAKETHTPVGKISKLVKIERSNFLSHPLAPMETNRKIVKKYL